MSSRTRRQPQSNGKFQRPSAPSYKTGKPPRQSYQPWSIASDTAAANEYKKLPQMSVEERKAAQLERWRRELGLDESGRKIKPEEI